MPPESKVGGLLALALAGWALGGCGGELTGTDPASSITPRSQWRAFGDLPAIRRIIDGSRATAAATGRHYDNASFTIDLGKPCLFNMVGIEHGPDEFGFCRRVALWTSLDGESYTKVHEAPGTRKVTFLVTVTPVLARYLRLQAAIPGERPWSVAEVLLR
jgi:hypothetical protein